MELILGTAGFANPYGTMDKVPSDYDRSLLLSTAIKANITLLDTSPNYGSSHELLAEVNKNRFRVGTKIKTKSFLDLDELVRDLSNLKLQLKIECFEYVLLHDFPKLDFFELNIVSRAFELLKQEGLCRLCGVSIYFETELATILRYPTAIDVVQAPGNFLDQRFIKPQILEAMRNVDICIHYRSVFLQGVLLQKPAVRQKYFSKFSELRIYDELVKNYFDSDYLNFNINFMKQCLKEGSILLGSATGKQMKQVLDCWEDGPANFIFPEMHFNEDLVIPMRWG